MSRNMPAWRLYLMLCETESLDPSDDALDHAISLDADRLQATDIDRVAYMEHSTFASLDDEIEGWERI